MTVRDEAQEKMLRIDLTVSQWAILVAAVRSADVAGAHLGEGDVYDQRPDGSSPFADIASRVDCLRPSADLYTLEVDDAEFSLLLVAAERAMFRGIPRDRVVVNGDVVDLMTDVPRHRLQEMIPGLFKHLMALPHRPTVRLDGGVVV